MCKPKTLALLLQTLCPSWQQIAEVTREDWIGALAEEFNVVGNWDDEAQDVVPFEIEQLEFEELVAIPNLTEKQQLVDWLADDEDWFISDSDWDEIQELRRQTSDICLQATVIEAGLKFCGTLIQKSIRVTGSPSGTNEVLHIIHVNGSGRSSIDRTYGPMWESPDGIP